MIYYFDPNGAAVSITVTVDINSADTDFFLFIPPSFLGCLHSLYIHLWSPVSLLCWWLEWMNKLLALFVILYVPPSRPGRQRGEADRPHGGDVDPRVGGLRHSASQCRAGSLDHCSEGPRPEGVHRLDEPGSWSLCGQRYQVWGRTGFLYNRFDFYALYL